MPVKYKFRGDIAEMIFDDNGLKLTFPEGFSRMDEEETKKLNFTAGGEPMVFEDKNRHIIISLGINKINAISAFILSNKDISKITEKQMRKANDTYGYTFGGFKECFIGGRKAEGFAYSYRVGETEMTAEVYTLKANKSIYYFYFYTRTESKAENLKLFSELLSSAQWANS